MPSSTEASSWKAKLLSWYREKRRDLPWRRTSDPYPVWVSEVMLQQTQVATALPYYERWMARFPTLESLAASTEQEVLEVWQGLGYYRRAKLLRAGAQHVLAHGMPLSIVDWLDVPGVGPYTAAAVGSIAQGLPAAVVDGNVERVFARFTACGETGARLLKAARAWAQQELCPESPSDWNQALMELGALVCTPRRPVCESCPIESSCVARQSWSVEHYPTTSPPPAIERQTHIVWVPYHEGHFGVRQIPEGQWWSGMWEFPRASEGSGDTLASIAGSGWQEELGTVRHQVTRYKIEIRTSLLRCESRSELLEWLSLEQLGKAPMPSPQRKVLRLACECLGLSVPNRQRAQPGERRT